MTQRVVKSKVWNPSGTVLDIQICWYLRRLGFTEVLEALKEAYLDKAKKICMIYSEDIVKKLSPVRQLMLLGAKLKYLTVRYWRVRKTRWRTTSVKGKR